MTDAEPPPAHAPAPALLEVTALRIERFRAGVRETIVSSLDLSIAEGETIGIVGESGSGKSMSGRALVGLLPRTVAATGGTVSYCGQNLLTLKESGWRRIRGREIGLVMQDPFSMLNPVMRCGRIIEESLQRDVFHDRRERQEESIRQLAQVGIADEGVVERYPFQLSGGMRQRVGIAAALARDPKLLIADEPSTALDVTTQREILALIKRIQLARNMGLILITHDLRVAFSMCDRIYVLYAGRLVEVAPAKEMEAEPLHPYSHGLLLSEPSAERRVERLVSIPGAVPSAAAVSGSCAFAPRCQWALPTCNAGEPPLAEVGGGRLSACIRISEIGAEMASVRARDDPQRPLPETLTTDAIVEVRGLRKVFRSGGRTVTAVDGVSLIVGHGEGVGLAGESGSGKTTVARILVGLETATEGEVSVAGVNTADWNALSRADVRLVRRTAQIVFQDPYSSLNPMRSIGSMLAEVITTHNPKSKVAQTEVADLLQAVGLPTEYAGRRPVALSGGERQRVAIARALAVQPKVLICDEPVSALDVSVQAQILTLLGRLRRELGLGYLLITHDLSILRQMTERLYIMHRGRIVESGATDAVLSDPQDPYTRKLLASVPRSEAAWIGSGDDA
jgi:peptide/nickel transport system ATP-binding protein